MQTGLDSIDCSAPSGVGMQDYDVTSHSQRLGALRGKAS